MNEDATFTHFFGCECVVECNPTGIEVGFDFDQIHTLVPITIDTIHW